MPRSTRWCPRPVWTRSRFRGAARPGRQQRLAPTTVDVVGRVEQGAGRRHEVQLAMPDRPPAAQADADRRRPRAAGPAAARRVRHRHRGRASGRSHPLPDRDRPAPRPAAHAASTPTGERMERVHAVRGRLRRTACARCPRPARPAPTSATSRWQIEELRVSLWAQQLGTAAAGQRAAHLPGDRRSPALRCASMTR